MKDEDSNLKGQTLLNAAFSVIDGDEGCIGNLNDGKSHHLRTMDHLRELFQLRRYNALRTVQYIRR